MVLRESAKANGIKINLKALVDPHESLGLPHGEQLLGFTRALVDSDEQALSSARQALCAAMSDDAAVAAAAIAANFSRNDLIANATGIPLEADFVKQSEDFRAELGINDFASAINSLK